VKRARCEKRLKPTQNPLWPVYGDGTHVGAPAGKRIRLIWLNKPVFKREAKMSEPTSVSPMLNKTMKIILRSPLHGMISKYLTLITFTGRKSGKTYTTPVSYYQQNNQVKIFTHANWWKNLRNGAPVTLRLRGRDIQGLAEPVAEDKQTIATALAAHLQKSPFDARFYDVTIDDHGNPIQEEVEKAVQTVTMVQVQLSIN